MHLKCHLSVYITTIHPHLMNLKHALPFPQQHLDLQRGETADTVGVDVIPDLPQDHLLKYIRDHPPDHLPDHPDTLPGTEMVTGDVGPLKVTRILFNKNVNICWNWKN